VLTKLVAGALGAAAVSAAVVLAPTASADVFDVCPSGRSGVVGNHTSCAFADVVAGGFWRHGYNFSAFSPATGQWYGVNCYGNYTAYFVNGAVRTTTHCYAGTNAEVVVW
jgi:hypothetical protein